MATGPNQALNPQLHQQTPLNPQQPGGPRTKSFDNPSASSTTSSGVGTSISSLNATNTNLVGAAAAASLMTNANINNTSAPPTPNVVKKYYEQKYGSTTNMMSANMMGGVGVGGVGIGGGGASGVGMMSGVGASSNLSSPMNDKMIPPMSRNGAPRNYTTATSNINMNMGGTSGAAAGMTSTSNSFLNMNSVGGSTPNNNPLGAGLSSLTSQFTSGIANLKLTASNFQANKLTSKFMNPFSS